METESAAARVVSPALVGRASDLEALVGAVCEPPVVAMVQGEAGVGKTRLVDELLAAPRMQDRVRLAGRCPRIREAFPLAPLLAALRGLGETVDGLALSPVAGAVAPLLPEIAAWLPAPPPPLDDRTAERHRVFRGMAELLGALGPAVVVLDDLHWADEQTEDFLSFLLADPPPELGIVLCFRGEEASPTVRALTASLPRRIGRVAVGLRPLDERQVGALAAAILGIDSVTAEFANYLCQRTGGLPFAIEEVLALLQARGTLIRTGGEWARKALDQLAVPSGIRDSTLERLSRLSQSARALAEAAAVLQGPVPVPVLMATCEELGEAGGAALDEALRAVVLVEHGETVGFRHVLAAQAVYEAIRGPRRRELHTRAAAALKNLPITPLGQLAHHLRHADRLTEWAAAAEAAADQAIELAHESEAVRLLDDLLRHTPLGPNERGRIAVKLGWAAVETLHAHDVVDTLTDLGDEELVPAFRAELRFLIAIALGQSGQDPARQRRLFLEAIPGLQDRPDLQAWAMVALGLTTLPDVALSDDMAWVTRSLTLVDKIDDPLMKVFVLGKAGATLMEAGSPAWRDVADRVLEITNGRPDQRREANAYCSLGVAACYTGHLKTASDLLGKGLHTSAADQNPRLEMMLRCALAVLHYCDGTWDGLREDVAGLLADVGDYATSRMDLELVDGALALATGDRPTATSLLERAAAVADEIGAYEVLPLAAGLSARAALASSDIDSAVKTVHRLVEVVEVKGVWAPAGWALPAVTEVLTAAGQSEAAEQFTTHAEQELRALDAPLASPALRHARGLLTTSSEDLLAAADYYDDLPAPYEAARAREHAAAHLFGQGNEQHAAPTLRHAFRTYQRLGATADQARSASLGRRHGLRLPLRRPGGRRSHGDQLTPRERQVAELAGAGRTNKEIAAELYVSPSTVEKHMFAAMRKLQVRSRTELARRLATTDAQR